MPISKLIRSAAIHAALLPLLAAPLAAQLRVRDIADVKLGATRYMVEAHSDGDVVLSGTSGLSPVHCWLTAREVQPWIDLQQRTLDSVVSPKKGGQVKIEQRVKSKCRSAFQREVKNGVSSLVLHVQGAFDFESAWIPMTRGQADDFMRAMRVAAASVAEFVAGNRSGTPEPGGGGHVFSESQVTKKAVPATGSRPPAYPDSLRARKVKGDVVVQFVVDANGLMIPGTLKIVRSAHPAFSQAVAATIGSTRFIPAELNGKKVNQVVTMTFPFSPPRL